MRRTAVWISRDEIVDFLEYAASSVGRLRSESRQTRLEHLLEASVAMRSKISFTNELRMAMALFEMPVSGWTCLRTGSQCQTESKCPRLFELTLVDVRGVRLLSDLFPLLLVLPGCRRLGSLLRGLCALSRLCGCLGGSGCRGLSGGGGGFGGHWYQVWVAGVVAVVGKNEDGDGNRPRLLI
jgi:hypothetical protein